MKYLTLILLTMLIGCQTIDTLPLNTSSIKPIVKTQQKADKKIPVPSPPPNNIDIIQTTKPVLCGPIKEVLDSMMKEYAEKPFVTWHDSAHGYPVMLLLNKQTRTSTVLEYPGLIGNSIYNDKACIISVGVNTEVTELSSVKTHIHLIEK